MSLWPKLRKQYFKDSLKTAIALQKIINDNSFPTKDNPDINCMTCNSKSTLRFIDKTHLVNEVDAKPSDFMIF